MLVAERLEVRYGSVPAVRAVDLAVSPGEIVALLGPNGAGKTSTLRAVSRLPGTSGVVHVDGRPAASPAVVRAAGIVHVPQGRGLFRELTVEQNLALAALGTGGAERRAAVAGAVRRVPEIERWRRRRLASLSGGEQVLVALARLLAGRPRYALVDELALGLAPVAADRVYGELASLRAEGVGMVIVEQHAARALEVADRVVLLERGVVVETGTPAGVGGPAALAERMLGALA